jgi:hypothetical protein
MSPLLLLLAGAPALAGTYYEAEVLKGLEAGDLSVLTVTANPRSLKFDKKIVTLDHGQETEKLPFKLVELDGELTLRLGGDRTHVFREIDPRSFETDVFGEPPSVFVKPKVPLEIMIANARKKEAIAQLSKTPGIWQSDKTVIEIAADGKVKLDKKPVEVLAEPCLEACEAEKKRTCFDFGTAKKKLLSVIFDSDAFLEITRPGELCPDGRPFERGTRRFAKP